MVNKTQYSTNVRRLWALCVGVLLAGAPASADVRLPHIFGNDMVLQREMPVPVWGWADPGEAVTVKFNGHEAAAKADEQGKWMVRLPAMPAGGPVPMDIVGKNTLQLTNVLIGEVWLCSGQSNMEMGIRSVRDGEQEISQANFPNVRLFNVPRKTAPKPETDVDATWKPCSPDNLGSGGLFNQGYPAVAYFFGREIHRTLGVPVGLVATSWGGTRIEPWTPPEGFAGLPALQDVVKVIDEATPKYNAAIAKAVTDYEAWIAVARKAVDARQPVPAPPAWPKHQLDDSGQPTGLYNAMVYPLVPFAIRGAIWYQGESNHPDGMLYCEKMKALIGGWRKVWNEGEFPFYFVQIAPLNSVYPGETLPRLREAQTASLAIPNTGMAVTVDIGDLNDIHPKNKQEVARRLSLWALAQTYGRKDVVFSGPLYRAMAVEGSKIRVQFDHVGGGLASRDGKPLTWFEIAGADRKFVKAAAEIDGEAVVVHADGVADPAAVRFAWDRAAEPNLINKEGLPASPFRTDQW